MDENHVLRQAQRRGRRIIAALLCVIAGLLLVLGTFTFLVLQAKRAGALTNPHERRREARASLAVMTAADRVARQAVAIQQVIDAPGRFAIQGGVGIIFVDGLVFAPAHVLSVGEFSQGTTVYCNGAFTEAEVLFTDELRDFAAISAPECYGDALSFSEETLRRETPLHVAGYTFNADGNPRWFHLTTNILPGERVEPENAEDDNLRRMLERRRELDIAPPIALNEGFVRGNSGSFVFTEQGDLVGMVIMSRRRGSVSYMVPAGSMLDSLDEHGVPH